MLSMQPHMADFDPKSAREDEILWAARWLGGRTLGEIGFHRRDLLEEPPSNRNKHVPGHVYERYFNIKQDSDPSPDFRAAGIELKSSGLAVRADRTIGQKERVSLKMLGSLDPGETWESSPLRSKLDNLLLVFYGYEPKQPIASFRTLATFRWSPSYEELELIAGDWRTIRQRRLSNLPLSESWTRVLASSTKGPGRRTIKTRGYSLKPRFVHYLYLGASGKASGVSIASQFGGPLHFEVQVRALLDRYLGRPVALVAGELGVPDRSKNAAATVVRRIVGLPARGRTREFEQYGLEVKIVPVSPVGRPHEFLSFPSFLPLDLLTTTWEESDLLASLNRILFVPLVRPRRKDPPMTAIFGRSVFWSPSERLLEAIQEVWMGYQQNVADGRPNDYPRKSDNLPIFINSHGRTAKDQVPALNEELVMKRSFWLHPDVVSDALGY